MSDKKYLRFDLGRHPTVGLHHHLYLLRIMLAEALLLNRTLILPPIRLPAHHNFGTAISFPHSHIYATTFNFPMISGGDIRRMQVECSEEHAIDQAMFSAKDTLRIDGCEPADANATQTLMVRRIEYYDDIGWIEARLAGVKLIIVPTPSARIAAIFEKLRDRLNADFDAKIFNADPVFHRRRKRLNQLYACAHVRGGDRTRLYSLYKAGITPQMVFKNIKRALPSRDVPLYLMTDIRDQAFFSKIKRHWPVKSIDDFPELSAFLPDAKRPGDNLSLFAVEELIMRNAAVRIHSHPQRQLHFSF